MLSNQQVFEKIDKITTIAYYWLGEDNFQCAQTICGLLNHLDLTRREFNRVNELQSDIKTMAKSKNKSLDGIEEIKIPPACVSKEEKLLWISINVLMNLFNSGNFEMGYLFLTELSEDWNMLYINIIPVIKASSFKTELADWAVEHLFFAVDILGKDDFEAYGYKIEKI